MHDEELEQPSRTAAPRRKACWAIRKALRDAPGGLTTNQLIERAREYWADDPQFKGERLSYGVRVGLIFLQRGGLIKKVEQAQHA